LVDLDFLLKVDFNQSNSFSDSSQDDFKSWQEGFRALLPNINISFSGTVLISHVIFNLEV
jgi:hypothetical protein